MRIGITGTIASGKTTFSKMLRQRGMPVFNADQYAAICLYGSHPCAKVIASEFGDVCMPNGDIDHKKLAAAVFHDETKRTRLNAIVHPYVIAGMEHFFSSQNGRLLFAEVPLLFEAGIEDHFDCIVLITCDKDTAIMRMMHDRGYSKEEALARYASQIDPQIQKQKADIVIENNGTTDDLNHAVNNLMKQLRAKERHHA